MLGLRVEVSRLRVFEFRVEDSGFGFLGLGLGVWVSRVPKHSITERERERERERHTGRAAVLVRVLRVVRAVVAQLAAEVGAPRVDLSFLRDAVCVCGSGI